jgi:hypothetical protein
MSNVPADTATIEVHNLKWEEYIPKRPYFSCHIYGKRGIGKTKKAYQMSSEWSDVTDWTIWVSSQHNYRYWVSKMGESAVVCYADRLGLAKLEDMLNDFDDEEKEVDLSAGDVSSAANGILLDIIHEPL